MFYLFSVNFESDIPTGYTVSVHFWLTTDDNSVDERVVLTLNASKHWNSPFIFKATQKSEEPRNNINTQHVSAQLNVTSTTCQRQRWI